MVNFFDASLMSTNHMRLFHQLTDDITNKQLGHAKHVVAIFAPECVFYSFNKA